MLSLTLGRSRCAAPLPTSCASVDLSAVFDLDDSPAIGPPVRDGGPREDAQARTPTGTRQQDVLAAHVSAMCRGDERALDALHGACGSRMHSCAVSIVRRFELAEEVVSSSFVQAWREASRFDGSRGPVIAWLLMITRSRSLDALRGDAARAAHEVCAGDDDFEGSGESGCSGPDVLLECDQRARALRALLATLSSPQRQAIALAFMNGMSHGEVARHTGQSLGTTKSHIQRGLAVLRDRCIASALSP